MVRAVAGLLVASALAAALLATAAMAADPVEIPLTIEKHVFSPTEIRVKAGAPFVLIITNKDATAEEFESKDLRVEKVVPANKTDPPSPAWAEGRHLPLRRRVP